MHGVDILSGPPQGKANDVSSSPIQGRANDAGRAKDLLTINERNSTPEAGYIYLRTKKKGDLLIIPEKNRREISKYLFQEGVCYAKKDYNLAKHPEIDVPNLQVIKLMQSFKSKNMTYLNLPSEIVPATLKKSVKPPGRPMGGPPGDRPRGPPRFDGDRPRFGDRDGYRGGPRGPPGEFGGDKGGAPADFQPSFRVIIPWSVLDHANDTASQSPMPFKLFVERISFPIINKWEKGKGKRSQLSGQKLSDGSLGRVEGLALDEEVEVLVLTIKLKLLKIVVALSS
ncbi:40S ribosomal protein S10-1 [Vitis vinifera]|uniref:40S ribosomal protein S10-1 n=1 Tax=Vitis vinifera TaxID=29760 RepID=A0A438IZ06_VITVI|nr:40S ribosomal protein S10-1 [Vitis vinifera]